MEKAEIFESAVGLPKNERKELIETLVESLKQKVDVDGVVRIAGAIVGANPFTPGRNRPVIMARALASYRLRRYDMTYSEIGRVFGKDHSTVIHYCKIIEAALDMPRAFRDIASYWEQMLEVYPL